MISNFKVNVYMREKVESKGSKTPGEQGPQNQLSRAGTGSQRLEWLSQSLHASCGYVVWSFCGTLNKRSVCGRVQGSISDSFAGHESLFLLLGFLVQLWYEVPIESWYAEFDWFPGSPAFSAEGVTGWAVDVWEKRGREERTAGRERIGKYSQDV